MLGNDIFDRWAAGYNRDVIEADERGAFPFAGYREVIGRVYDRAKTGGRILDLGVGTGAPAGALIGAGADVTGVDFSAEMLSIARAALPTARLLQWDFAQGLPPALGGERFDAVISTYAMHHLTDDGKLTLLRRLKPHLSEGGVIYMGDIMFETEAALRLCRETDPDYDDEDEYYWVFETLREELAAEWLVEFEPVSRCAALITLRALPGAGREQGTAKGE